MCHAIWRSGLKVSQEAINLIRRSVQNLSSGFRLNPGVSFTVTHQQIHNTQKSTCWWENSFKWNAIIWALICLLVIQWFLQFARYTFHIYRLRVTLDIFYDHLSIKETIWFINNFKLSSILPQGRSCFTFRKHTWICWNTRSLIQPDKLETGAFWKRRTFLTMHTFKISDKFVSKVWSLQHFLLIYMLLSNVQLVTTWPVITIMRGK